MRSACSGDLSTLPPNYKWMALFISTLGMLMATIDGSIVLISLPNIFRGIGIDPLEAGNTFFLLWMILGFLVVTSVLVVTLGRLGDIYGRVRIYNLGFAVFTFFSLMLSITWMYGHAAGVWLIVMRIFQGVGAAMLMANSAAILTDVFPDTQRGLALGVNQAAAFSGTFIGLVLGGVLAPLNWRWIFLVSVPVGLLGTIMGYLEAPRDEPAPTGPDRLARKHHLCHRADPGHDRDHLRHRALRRTRDGVDQPVGAGVGVRRRRPPVGVLRGGDPRGPARCSGSSCSRSGPSPPGSWPASWPH